MLKTSVAAAVLIIALSYAWKIGNEHREQCLREQRVSCSIMPWDYGRQPPPVPTPSPAATVPPDAFWDGVGG